MKKNDNSDGKINRSKRSKKKLVSEKSQKSHSEVFPFRTMSASKSNIR